MSIVARPKRRPEEVPAKVHGSLFWHCLPAFPLRVAQGAAVRFSVPVAHRTRSIAAHQYGPGRASRALAGGRRGQRRSGEPFRGYSCSSWVYSPLYRGKNWRFAAIGSKSPSGGTARDLGTSTVSAASGTPRHAGAGGRACGGPGG